MENQELKSLNLSEKDFDLIIEWLDVLPDRNQTGDLMIDMLGAFAFSKTEEEKLNFEKELEKRRNERELDKKTLKEDVKILQGKLLILKRFLQENVAIDHINESSEVILGFIEKVTRKEDSLELSLNIKLGIGGKILERERDVITKFQLNEISIVNI